MVYYVWQERNRRLFVDEEMEWNALLVTIVNSVKRVTRVMQVNTNTTRLPPLTAGPDNKNGYAGKLPLCNKCKLHHTGPCTVKCYNDKRVGHMIRDCRTPVLATTQRPPVVNQKTAVTCYGCGKQRHYRSECSKLKNHNFGNQKGNKEKDRGNPNVIIDHANG
ncbi:reverse transcriptase domain-containing protein [Tanacetum coccineum]